MCVLKEHPPCGTMVIRRLKTLGGGNGSLDGTASVSRYQPGCDWETAQLSCCPRADMFSILCVRRGERTLQISVDTQITNCKSADQPEMEEGPVLGPAGSYSSPSPGITSGGWQSSTAPSH